MNRDFVYGNVDAVDRSTGTVDATLRSGQKLFDVPYLGMPPWAALDARFTEVASGSWICHGLQGELGGFGPNLVTNGDFDANVDGWDTSEGVTDWNFDTGTMSWTGTSCSLALETDYVFNGLGALRVTATSGATISATSPTGTSGVAVTAGVQYQANVWVQNDPSMTNRVCQIRMKWYKSGGGASIVLANSPFGNTFNTDDTAWRSVSVTATAPIDAVTAAIEVQFVSAANGDKFFIDSALFTGGITCTVAWTTTSAYSGTGSLRIRSSAAAMCFAQTPAPWTDQGAGIPVVEQEVLHVECRFRQTNGLQLFIMFSWVSADGSSVVDYDYDARSSAGTSSYQYFTGVKRVPTGVVAVHVAFAFMATGSSQDMYIDAVKVRRAFVMQGNVISSVNPSGFTSYPGGKQQTPGMLTFVPNESDFPAAIMNGYLRSRALHGRILKNSGTQSIAQNTSTKVNFDAIAENAGMTVSPTSSGYIQVPRSAYYHCTGQLTWATGLNSSDSAGLYVELWRYSSDGATALACIARQGFSPAGSAWWAQTLNVSITARLNRDERLYMLAFQGMNSSGTNISPALGVPHMLVCTYVGDA